MCVCVCLWPFGVRFYLQARYARLQNTAKYDKHTVYAVRIAAMVSLLVYEYTLHMIMGCVTEHTVRYPYCLSSLCLWNLCESIGTFYLLGLVLPTMRKHLGFRRQFWHRCGLHMARDVVTWHVEAHVFRQKKTKNTKTKHAACVARPGTTDIDCAFEFAWPLCAFSLGLSSLTKERVKIVQDYEVPERA